jgi:hypothetical protein
MKHVVDVITYYWYLLVIVPVRAMWHYKTIFWYRAWKKEHKEKIRRGDYL